VGEVPEPRRQVRGTGRPKWTRDPVIFDGVAFGICAFVDIDPDDPPRVESQAASLKRHRLLTARERACLMAADYEPGAIDVDDEEE
jgi:hypothetical protein